MNTSGSVFLGRDQAFFPPIVQLCSSWIQISKYVLVLNFTYIFKYLEQPIILTSSALD